MKRRFSIPWADLAPLLDGTSSVDASRIEIRSIDDAEDFLESYGYDWKVSDDREELDRLRLEAIEFVERDLLFDKPAVSIPREVRQEKDIRKLLFWSSEMAFPERQRWAWVIFRLIHIFSHTSTYFDEKYGDAIREQILGRFRPHVAHNIETGELTLGTGPTAIKLNAFEIRGRKSRSSVAIKLLHKREAGGTDIFDWVGVRMVTEDRYDALRVVRYLREHNVINFMQLQPGRTRNTLLDIDRIENEIHELNELVRAGKLPDYVIESELRERVNRHAYPSPPEKSYNPNSSLAYHSIQFTCRQRIRVRDRSGAAVSSFLEKVPLRANPIVKTLRVYADRIEPAGDIRFLFPFELQILDQPSYELSRSGLASHQIYKDRQRQRAIERLFGEDFGTDHD